MTETIPEGPTDPRLSMSDDKTTVVTPGYGAPLHTGSGTAPIPYSRPPIVPGPPGPVGSPIVPVTEQLDEHPSGRIYTSDAPTQLTTPAPVPEVGADRGKTTITEGVVKRTIDKIVQLTVDEVDGVVGLTQDGSDGAGESVVVRQQDDDVEIDITIKVAFGHVVHEVVDRTRARVIGQTERLLGLNVTDVNVTVADVSFDDAPGDDTLE
jgi:uncharacterized alkaline shock family protein YloU